ncbi:MAG TPA: alkaline phosphatase family protein, partial [Bryobacteraceae bacterium]|nr:alkaline phosphatase family protein [Bryobacteraceae bacterium]
MLALAAVAAPKTENIIFVMTDGLRWQELFGGADAALMNKEHGAVANVEALKGAYWRETPEARREALMPFLWSVIAKQGQIYGNRALGSQAHVTNEMRFSYPGYSETLCGFVDPQINSNNKIPNANVTVLEWLHRKPAFKGKVAAFSAWDVFPYIFNAERAGFPVNAAHAPFSPERTTPRLQLLNELKAELPQLWPAEAFDAITFQTALEYMKERKPRVMFLSLGETDEFAHEGKYSLYLDAAKRVDQYLKRLWETAQSIPQYKGKTTLIFSPDHGRGDAPVEWKSHGQKVLDSRYIWMAFLGPDTPALGERSKTGTVTQNQIAATLASLLG